MLGLAGIENNFMMLLQVREFLVVWKRPIDGIIQVSTGSPRWNKINSATSNQKNEKTLNKIERR